MEERQDAENAVVGVEMKDLFELFDVGSQIEVRKNDAFGFSGGTTGEDDRGGVVERGRSFHTEEQFQQTRGEEFYG